jgi:3'-phosphoadenosine 5'-phosphosulfate sulfotransferase (PAPS reductase)/FAD synthetase
MAFLQSIADFGRVYALLPYQEPKMPFNPYFIKEPFCVSFSGGRSSGFMLYQILQAHGGTLPDHGKVIFANTGKEMPETLDFVQACSDHWGVDITWVEYGGQVEDGIQKRGRYAGKPKYKETTRIVDYATASRAGEPYEVLIRERKMPPSWRARFCTSALKVHRIHDIMTDIGPPGIADRRHPW